MSDAKARLAALLAAKKAQSAQSDQSAPQVPDETASAPEVKPASEVLSQPVPAQSVPVRPAMTYIVEDHAEADTLKMKMAELEDALEQDQPEFRNLLREIHRKLLNDPDCVTAFTDEGIGLLVSGLIKHTNTEIVAPAKVKAAKRLSKNVSISADDL